LELYRKNAADIDLVISDLGMPVSNGYELLLELRTISPDLPIIISTGYEDNDLKDQKHTAVLLKKPYYFEQLREAVKSVLVDTQQKEG